MYSHCDIEIYFLELLCASFCHFSCTMGAQVGTVTIKK